jgi:hypothetical protein
MKRHSMLLACFSLLGVSANVDAQSCAAPIFLNDRGTASGDTCAASNELGTLCIFAQSPGNDVVYSINMISSYISVNLTNNTPAWNAALVLIGGACNGNSICPRNADSGGPGEDETLFLYGVSPGPYFLIVTSSTSDTTCGAYSVLINSVPVELQSFEIV